jgi:molecular chaperone GrpE
MIGMTDKARKDKLAAEDRADAANPAGAEGEIPPEEPMEAAAEAGSEEQPTDSADLAARLVAAEAEIAQLKEERLRALAETENVRRRAARDKADASKYSVTAFARDLLSVADNLQRALGSVDPEARQTDPALETLVEGVELTEKELLAIFERHGITPIEALGQPFDPHFHEAMYEVADASIPTGTVAQVIQSGYMIHDRPLRAAGVGVSRGGPKPTPQPIPDAEAEAEAETAASDGETHPTKGSTAAYEKQAETQADTSGAHLDEKF